MASLESSVLTFTFTLDVSVFFRENGEDKEAFFDNFEEAALFADRKSYLAPFSVKVCVLITAYLCKRRSFSTTAVYTISKGELV